MAGTIIQPVAFMEDMTADFHGEGVRCEVASEWHGQEAVAGVFCGCRHASCRGVPDQYASKAISLATDEPISRQASEIFKRVIGKNMPTTHGFVG
jgi:hypothetical protein